MPVLEGVMASRASLGRPEHRPNRQSQRKINLPQKALEHIAPVQALKRWRDSQPALFVKQVRNHLAPDSCRVPGSFRALPG